MPRPSRGRQCSVPRRRRGYSDSIPSRAVWQMSTLLITTTRLCYMGHPTAETSGLHSCCLDVVQISMRGTRRDTQLHRVLVRPGHEAGARYIHTIQLLLEHGADVDALDDTQSTPLHVASEYGSAMLECGASVHLQNNWGQTPSQVASAKGHEEIARLLLEHSQSEQKMCHLPVQFVHKVPEQSHPILSYFIVTYSDFSFVTFLPKRTNPQRSGPCPHWEDCQCVTVVAMDATQSGNLDGEARDRMTGTSNTSRKVDRHG